MRRQGLQALRKGRSPGLPDSRHGRNVAPQRLLETAPPTKPNQVWITDITYIPTKEGWLFLAAEIDLFTRNVRGWAARDNMETPLVIDALDRAVAKTPGRLAGLIHHSDQGSQYASEIFTAALAHLAMDQSMSRRANCYDNATAESFWATLKTECFDNTIPATRAKAKSMIFDYIETFYNPVRRHSALGFLSPVAFENQFNNNQLFPVRVFGSTSEPVGKMPTGAGKDACAPEEFLSTGAVRPYLEMTPRAAGLSGDCA